MDGHSLQLLIHLCGFVVGVLCLTILAAAFLTFWAVRNWRFVLLGTLFVLLFFVIDHGVALRQWLHPS
jgi:hypothetical protein